MWPGVPGATQTSGSVVDQHVLQTRRFPKDASEIPCPNPNSRVALAGTPRFVLKFNMGILLIAATLACLAPKVMSWASEHGGCSLDCRGKHCMRMEEGFNPGPVPFFLCVTC